MRKLKNIHKSILLLFLFSGYFPILFSQQLSTELISRLSPSDQKKIQKADELYKKGVQSEEEADKLFEPRKSQLKRLEASEYYQNSATEQSKVLKNNIKSFWKKYSGNKNELEPIRKLEDAALDSLNSAKTIRNQVEKEGKIEQRIALLRKAEKVEKNALLRLQKILYVYISLPVHYDEKWIASESNTILVATTAKVESPKSTAKGLDTIATVKKTNVQTNDSSIYGIVKVNEEQIDKFNEFLKKTYPSDVEKYVINFSELDYSDINQLKDAWYTYQFGTDAGGTSYSLIAENTKDSVSKSSTGSGSQTASLTSSSHNNSIQVDSIASNPDKKEETGKNIAITGIKNAVEKDTNPSEIKETEQKSGKEISPENKSSLKKEEKTVAVAKTDKKEKTAYYQQEKEVVSKTSMITGKAVANADFIYRVQIAACRIPIDQKVLQDIYNGPEKILELEEELWYKYAIGNFSSYREAHEFAESSKIPGAFVISYLNGKRIKSIPVVSKNESSSKGSVITPGGIEFRVQIAASKSQIPDRLLKNIFNDIKSLKISSENGWYKYSLPAGKTVDEARALINTLSIPGAFVIAYQNGVKIDLAEAVKLTSN